jgi:TRAP-type C4-dicarboxylate transport system substrate-binding protein
MGMNRERIGKRFWSAVICFIFVMGIFVTCVPQAMSASDKITWNVALWGGERDWTRPLHKYVKDMEKLTNGRWQIKLHYGSVLSPSKEHLDGLKAGLFEACQFCASYAPGKTPLQTVFELPFILPQDPQQMCQMMAALWELPVLKKELAKWNAVPFLPASITQYGLMGNKKIAKVADFKGVRIRISGEMARVVEMFGAAPTMIPVSDLYEAMERGTLDMATLPWAFSFGAFKINEVSKFVTTNFNPGSQSCAYLANKRAWDALPKEFQKYHMEWYKKAPKVWGDEYKKGDKRWIPIYKKTMEFVRLPDSERNKLVSKAEGVWKKWVERMEKKGLPGQKVLDYFLAKRKEIAGY